MGNLEVGSLGGKGESSLIGITIERIGSVLDSNLQQSL
jgi:hypothetical protein